MPHRNKDISTVLVDIHLMKGTLKYFEKAAVKYSNYFHFLMLLLAKISFISTSISNSKTFQKENHD